MKEGQEHIYYMVADSHAAAKDSPLLEIFKKKNIEVLLLSDPIDHLIFPELREFQASSSNRYRRARSTSANLRTSRRKRSSRKRPTRLKICWHTSRPSWATR